MALVLSIHRSIDELEQANEEARKRPWIPDDFEKDVVNALKVAKAQRRGDEVTAAKYAAYLKNIRSKYKPKLIFKKTKKRKSNEVKEKHNSESNSTFNKR